MLTSKQRALLASLASTLDPVVHLGKGGPTEALAATLTKALDDHELVKVRFVDFKDSRRDVARELAEAVGAELVRVIGNVAVFWRESSDPDKRKRLLDDEAPAEETRPARKPAASRTPGSKKPGAKRGPKRNQTPKRMMGPGR